MSSQVINTGSNPGHGKRGRRMLRSAGALMAGMVTGIVLSVGTDAVMVAIGIFPPLDQPKSFTTPLLLLATGYRTAYGILGSYMAARLAPDHPMRHALVLGSLGLAVCIAGAVAMWGYGPNWYPLALVVLALPTAWAGGRVHTVRAA